MSIQKCLYIGSALIYYELEKEYFTWNLIMGNYIF